MFLLAKFAILLHLKIFSCKVLEYQSSRYSRISRGRIRGIDKTWTGLWTGLDSTNYFV